MSSGVMKGHPSPLIFFASVESGYLVIRSWSCEGVDRGACSMHGKGARFTHVGPFHFSHSNGTPAASC